MFSKVNEDWLKVTAATLVSSFAVEALLLFWTMAFIPYRVSDFAPWTFSSLWLMMAVALSAYVLWTLGIYSKKYFYGLFWGSILANSLLIFLPLDEWLITYRYSGVETQISKDTHASGRFNELETPDSPITLGSIYEKRSIALQQNLMENSRYNEYVSTREFVFWQTGLASGFNPSPIDQYNGGNGFLNRIELIITTGPVVLIECFIKGLIKEFIFLMIFQIVWFVKFKNQYILFVNKESLLIKNQIDTD